MGVQPRELVRRWFVDGMNTGSAAAARRISETVFAEDFIDHDGIEQTTYGRDEWQRAVIDRVFAALQERGE